MQAAFWGFGVRGRDRDLGYQRWQPCGWPHPPYTGRECQQPATHTRLQALTDQ